MTAQIFRPKGLYILTNAADSEYHRVPVLGLDFGHATFAWDSPEGITTEGIVCGLEVHGEIISLHLDIDPINRGEAKVKWGNLAFNFTLFNLWVSGLSLEDKENVIDEVLSWQEDAQRHLVQQELSLKKVA
jgi:hypothetical protein